jgi:hypothetical protein
LIYLASQIRQNSKLLRASTASVSHDANSELNTLIVQQPEVARIFWEGMEDRDSLPMADQRRFTSLMAIAFQGNHQQYQFDRDGIGSPETWEYRERSMRWLFQYPGMQQCWREQNGFFPLDFREYINRLIHEDEAAA